MRVLHPASIVVSSGIFIFMIMTFVVIFLIVMYGIFYMMTMYCIYFVIMSWRFFVFSPALTAISKLRASNSQNERHKVYTSSDYQCGVIPYSSVVWWIAPWAEDEKYKGKNSLLRRGVLEVV